GESAHHAQQRHENRSRCISGSGACRQSAAGRVTALWPLRAQDARELRGKGGTSPRYRCRGTFDAGGTYCVMFGGAGVDRRFTQELLHVISPLGLQASLEALEGLNQREHEQRQTLEYKRVQLQYEAQRAFEQYNAVDPRHRLVAAELERRWN